MSRDVTTSNIGTLLDGPMGRKRVKEVANWLLDPLGRHLTPLYPSRMLSMDIVWATVHLVAVLSISRPVVCCRISP